MSQEQKPAVEENEVPNAERRGFIAAAIGAGAALAAGQALAGDRPAAAVRPEAAAKVEAAAALSAADQEKTLKIQEAIKAQLGDDVEIRWVKGHKPGLRRVIQMVG